MSQMELLLQSLDIIIEEKLWPNRKPSDIFNILLYVHNKGWLYTPIENDKVTAVICAFRIKEISDHGLTKVPLEEEGNILYIPFVLSLEKDKNLFHIIRKSCKIYLENNPNVNEIVLEDKNNNIKRYRLKTPQGERHGKESEIRTTSTADI